MGNDASIIMSLLRCRHSRDVFVPECKNGATQYVYLGGHRRIDAWAMKRSWLNFEIIGYEIKTSRADFLRDDKWREYLPMCHRFYFVVPWGLIDPREIESPAGLIYVAKTGGRLYAKKRAVRRAIEIPVDTLIYILFSRAIIAAPNDVWKYECGYTGLFDKREAPQEYPLYNEITEVAIDY